MTKQRLSAYTIIICQYCREVIPVQMPARRAAKTIAMTHRIGIPFICKECQGATHEYEPR